MPGLPGPDDGRLSVSETGDRSAQQLVDSKAGEAVYRDRIIKGWARGRSLKEGNGDVAIRIRPSRQVGSAGRSLRTTKADREQPKFGTLKGKVTTLDPDWWKPMTSEEVDAFLDGR